MGKAGQRMHGTVGTGYHPSELSLRQARWCRGKQLAGVGDTLHLQGGPLFSDPAGIGYGA